MRYQTILFDFDGTVYDTVEGITKSIQYALRKHGKEAELEELRCFAGPPLVNKFMEVYGVSREEGEELVRDFRERYTPMGLYESSPFPGIDVLLEHLKAFGFQIGLATSKPQSMAETLLRQSGLIRYFDVIAGSRMGPNNDEKWQIVLRAMDESGAGKDSTVLVGDTRYDVEGAIKCGIPCIGAGWGYGEEEELKKAGACYVAKNFVDLERYLTGRTGSN